MMGRAPFVPMRIVAGLVIFAGAVLSVLAGASVATFDSVTFEAPGWVILHVDALDDLAGVSVRSEGSSVVALALAYKDGQLVSSVPAALANNSWHLSVRSDGLHEDVQLLDATGSAATAGVLLHPGAYQVVLVAGGAGITNARYSVETTKATATEVARGHSVVSFDASEFDAALSAHAGIESARVSSGLSLTKTLQVEGTFLGFSDQGALPHPASVSSIRSGDTVRSCPCSAYAVTGDQKIGPGPVTFDWTGVSADLHVPLLFGADITGTI